MQTSSGAPLAFTNWCSGEPNNLGDEDCGELVCWRDRPCGCWNDGRCYADLLYVCEKPQQRGAELQGLAPVRQKSSGTAKEPNRGDLLTRQPSMPQVFHGSFPEAEGAYALWLLELGAAAEAARLHILGSTDAGLLVWEGGDAALTVDCRRMEEDTIVWLGNDV